MDTKSGENFLKKSSYPGRGIVIGRSKDSDSIFQIYWIMGRSENSRNRVFKEENGVVKTEPFDLSKVKDPSLIIYNAMREINSYHIVTNGDQTDTIYNYLSSGKSFEEALDTRIYEPDEPNFTPRISGVVDVLNREYSYKLSIIKTIDNNSNYLVRHYFNYKSFISGVGHCITTYVDHSTVLPSFVGEPYLVPIFNSLKENIEFYWSILNKDNLISIVAKEILKDNSFKFLIKNKNG